MAGTEDFNLNTVLSLQTDQFKAGVEAANLQSQKMKKNFKKSNDGILSDFSNMAKQMAAPLIAMASVGTVISFGKSSVEAAENSEKANKRLLFALDGNQLAFSDLSREADKLRKATGISGSSIKEIMQLGAGAGYSVDKIKKLTSASVELSSKTGKDLQGSYLLLNKTLSGTVPKALAALDPAFKRLSKSQLEHGAAIDLVNSKYGGMAAISATEMEKLTSNWAKLKVEVGKNGLSGYNALLSMANAAVVAITPTNELTKEMENQRLKVNSLATALTDHNLPLGVRKDLLLKLNQIAPEVVKNLNAEKINYDKLNSNLSAYNSLMLNKIILERKGSDIAKIVTDQASLSDKIEQKGIKVAEITLDLRNRITSSVTAANAEEKTRLNNIDIAFKKDGDAAKRLNSMYVLSQEIISRKNKLYSVDYGGAGEAKELANLIKEYNAAGWSIDNLNKKKQALAKKFGLSDYVTGGGSGKTENTNIGGDPKKEAKELTAREKLLELDKTLRLGFNKEIATDETEKKTAELNIWVETEKKKVADTKATIKEQQKSLDLIDEIAARKKDEITGNVGKMGVKNTQNNDSFGTVNDTSGLSMVGTGDNKLKLVNVELPKMNAILLKYIAITRTASTTSNAFWKGMRLGGETTEETINRMSTLASGLGSLSSQFGQQTEAYKLFASAQVALSTIISANEYATTMAWAGPVGIGIAQGLVYAIGAAQVAKIQGVKFADGGIVPGTKYRGDQIHAYVNSGEMILNSSQQSKLFSMLNGSNNSDSSNGSGGEIILRAKGGDLVGVINNHNRRQSKIK